MTKVEVAKENAEIRRRMKNLAHNEICNQLARYKINESVIENLTPEEVEIFKEEHQKFRMRIIKAL